MSGYLSPSEKKELANLQNEIDDLYAQARKLESTLKSARDEAGGMIGAFPDKLWLAANAENPLKAYREAVKLTCKAEELEGFAADLTPMVKRIIDTAAPLQRKQRKIDIGAMERRKEINRLEELRGQYGLNPGQEQALDKLKLCAVN